MFDSLKIAKDMFNLQREAKKLEKQMREIKAEAKSKGGLVRVVASAAGEILTIEIDESLLEAKNKAKLQDELTKTINKALKEAQKVAAASLIGDIKL